MPVRIVFLLAALALSGCGKNSDAGDNVGLAAKQAQVEQRGKSVMPFDIDRTMHHFRKLPSGGVQEVVSTDGDPRQIALIRQHLKSEADRFRSGDFSDPGSIHGPEMPGLSALSASARNIDIRYSEIPKGAQIAYASADPRLIAAIHAWFDAQVEEHGHHAMAARSG